MTKIPTILFATAELTPIAKVGGLADVAGALPPALRDLGVDIRVILPKYGSIDPKLFPSRLIAPRVVIPMGEKPEEVAVYETSIPGSAVPVYLIEHKKYLSTGNIYINPTAMVDSVSEIHRFAFFSRCIPYILAALNWYPDIVHCQDWHVGILPGLIKCIRQTDDHFHRTKTLFTIHNLANQGFWNKTELLSFLGLVEQQLPTPELPNGDVNLIQAGIVACDLLNTVSRTYAQEILTPEYGEGLQNDLRQRREILFGIVNGIDQNRFNPATDPDIFATYSPEALENKLVNKQALLRISNLATETKNPLFGLVTRLTNQKGIELIVQGLPPFLEQGAQFVALGAGSDSLERQLNELARQFPKQVAVTIGFDASLAQKIYAGSDFFLMPSRFEPCGLGQLIAMRYGTIPIVRATGGLKDTVTDYDPATRQGNGFVFPDYTADGLSSAIERAMKAFREPPEHWLSLERAAMTYDSSWHKAAGEYLQLYQKLVE